MRHLLAVTFTIVGLAATYGLAGAQAPGWEQGGTFKNSPYDDGKANDTYVGTEARETDASITTDYPGAAEPFENPNEIQEDEQED